MCLLRVCLWRIVKVVLIGVVGVLFLERLDEEFER